MDTMINKKYKIILVEDNPDDVFLIKYAIDELKISIELIVFNNGQSMIEYLNTNQVGFPDLILLDINLPKVNGLEILKAIKVKPIVSAIPTIILTSSDLPSDMECSYKYAASMYFLKPNNIQGFKEMMKYIIDNYLDGTKIPTLSS